MMYSLLKTKTCQVCKKSFSNGKALGGHMRSHTRRLSAESSTGSSSTPSLRPCNNLEANFRPHETVLMRSVHTNEVVGGPTPDLNKEGEQQITDDAERKIVVDLEEVNSIESLCGITIEQCALCLLQMSEDKRTETLQKLKEVYHLILTRKRKDTEKYIEIDSEEDQEDGDEFVAEDEDSEEEDNEDGDVTFLTSDVENLTGDSDEDEDDADENAYFGGREKKCKKQSKYVCDICGKVLRSYQALGGHRTSHRNKRLKIADKKQSAEAENGAAVRRHYKCEFCDRVFESGQALGGHKKIHYAYLQPTNLSTSSTRWP